MSDFEQETLENELASLRPARLAEDFAADLSRKLAGAQPEAKPSRALTIGTSFLAGWLRWVVIPAAAVGVLFAVLPLYRATSTRAKPTQKPMLAERASPAASTVSVLKPDAILVSEELVGNFDAVTQLPNGAPVRVRCQEWVDEVQLRDPARGVWVERRKPRVEIVRVGYEVY